MARRRFSTFFFHVPLVGGLGPAMGVIELVFVSITLNL